MATSSPYNVNIAPTAGYGAYGAVPGQIGLPSPASDLGAQYPNLGAINAQLSQNVLNESRGMLSPETVNNIQNTAAQWGVGSGMPRSGLGLNTSLASLGLTTEGVQHQGLGDYLNLAGGISKTQTLDPALQASIAGRNATFAAAPDPQTAALTQQNLYQQALDAMKPKPIRGPIPARLSNMPNLNAPGFGGATGAAAPPPYNPYGEQAYGALPGVGTTPGASPSALTFGNMTGGGGAYGANDTYGAGFGTQQSGGMPSGFNNDEFGALYPQSSPDTGYDMWGE
jgi:hypothetical protein